MKLICRPAQIQNRLILLLYITAHDQTELHICHSNYLRTVCICNIYIQSKGLVSHQVFIVTLSEMSSCSVSKSMKYSIHLCCMFNLSWTLSEIPKQCTHFHQFSRFCGFSSSKLPYCQGYSYQHPHYIVSLRTKQISIIGAATQENLSLGR